MISVIVPAFNAEKTISHCLKSLLSQKTSEKFEIIVVDDGSTDKTAEVVKKSSKVKLIQQKNQGPASARNKGVKQAKGKVIVFIDSDCIAEKYWLEEMTAPFRKDSRIVGVQGTYKSRQKELIARFEQLRIMQRHERMKQQESIDFVGSFSAAFRKNAFLQVGGFDESFPMASGEDTDLSFKLAEKGHKMVFNVKAVVWHKHQTSFLKYLIIKFWRAYWRIPLYNRHKNKLVSDSYTSPVIKFQMAMSICTIAALFPLVFSYFIYSNTSFMEIPFITFASLIPLSNLGFFFWAMKKDFWVAVNSFWINFCEAFALAFGMVLGMLFAWWKK